MGKQFAVQISERFGNWSSLQTTLLPALLTDPGRELYDKFLRVHRQLFPNYVAELEGLASGANIPFSTVFTAQLAQEFAGQLGQVVTAKPDACSDYMLCSQATCGGAHNEDGSGFNINRSFVADVQLGGPESRFRAFVYAGELPSGSDGRDPFSHVPIPESISGMTIPNVCFASCSHFRIQKNQGFTFPVIENPFAPKGRRHRTAPQRNM